MWVIVELNTYNDEGIGAFSEILGPYETEEKADKRCKELNDRDLYASEFEVCKLGELKHFSDRD